MNLARCGCVEYAVPKFKIREVNAAGETIANPPALPNERDPWEVEDWVALEDYENAMIIVNNFRSSHSFPLNTFQTSLRKRARDIDSSSLVAQRIKRLPAITQKLRRGKLKLAEIQDIGGCRAVVQTREQAERLVKVYQKGDLKHALERVDDYVQRPKATGYRSVHLVYRYRSDRNTLYNGLKIEIQLRSQLQHAWATAVETVGRFRRQPMKSGRGNKKWLRFFTLMGSTIARREGTPAVMATPDDRAELTAHLQRYERELNVFRTLEVYNTALETLEKNIEDAHFFLVTLEHSIQRVMVQGFARHEVIQANAEYAKKERQLSQATGDDAVLVSVDDMRALRLAYPNYFLDTRLFLNELAEALS